MQTVLRLTGTPYEQGEAQGRAVADDIAYNLAQIRRLIDSLIDGRDGWYRELIARNRAFIQSLDPDTLDELQGIADGSGISLDDIEAMNIPMYTVIRRANIVAECSVYAVGPAASRDWLTYLVKTRDQPCDQFQFRHLVAYRTYPDGRQIIEVNAAGIITNPGNGMNDAGLAVGTAGSWSKQHMDIRLADIDTALAMPDMHYLLRHATTVDEAQKVLSETPRLAGMNIIVADRSGDVATIEVTGDQALITRSEDGVIAITNHFVHPDLVALNDPPEAKRHSYTRYDTITGFLRERVGRLSSRDLLRLSMEHDHGPQESVCRHSDGVTGSTTRYVSLMAVEDFDVWTFAGFPCQMALVVKGGPDEQVRTPAEMEAITS